VGLFKYIANIYQNKNSFQPDCQKPAHAQASEKAPGDSSPGESALCTILRVLA